MKILFGGVRGSTPCAEPSHAKYGGHTTCVLVTGQGGELVLLDAGSGIRTVADRLTAAAQTNIAQAHATQANITQANAAQTNAAQMNVTQANAAPKLHILLTHLHLDHLLGLPMLPILHDSRWTVNIMGMRPTSGSLRETLDRLIAPPLWPFALEDFAATINVQEFATPHEIPNVGGLEFRGVLVPHPNGCTAWRVDEPATGKAMILATDMEWSASSPRQQKDFLDLCRQPHPIDMLVMDGHFAPDELVGKTGWGHSSTAECVAVARDCGASRLLITHHAPDHDDEFLDGMAAETRGLWKHADLARQGLEISWHESTRKES